MSPFIQSAFSFRAGAVYSYRQPLEPHRSASVPALQREADWLLFRRGATTLTVCDATIPAGAARVLARPTRGASLSCADGANTTGLESLCVAGLAFLSWRATDRVAFAIGAAHQSGSTTRAIRILDRTGAEMRFAAVTIRQRREHRLHRSRLGAGCSTSRPRLVITGSGSVDRYFRTIAW